MIHSQTSIAVINSHLLMVYENVMHIQVFITVKTKHVLRMFDLIIMTYTHAFITVINTNVSVVYDLIMCTRKL